MTAVRKRHWTPLVQGERPPRSAFESRIAAALSLGAPGINPSTARKTETSSRPIGKRSASGVNVGVLMRSESISLPAAALMSLHEMNTLPADAADVTHASTLIPAAIAHQTSLAPPFIVGDRIKARFLGRSLTWYYGRITGVNAPVEGGEYSCDILYDDGDVEEGASAANIRACAESKGQRRCV